MVWKLNSQLKDIFVFYFERTIDTYALQEKERRKVRYCSKFVKEQKQLLPTYFKKGKEVAYDSEFVNNVQFIFTLQ